MMNFFLRSTKLFSTASTTCNILHPHQWCTSVSNYSYPFQHLLFSGFHLLLYFFKITILVAMIHYLVVWICIFLITNNYKNLFMCLLATYIPCVYSSPLLTLNWAVCLFCCIVKDLYIFWISDMVMTNMFYNFLLCLFLMMSFYTHKSLIFMK